MLHHNEVTHCLKSVAFDFWNFGSFHDHDPLLLSKWPSGVPGQSKRQAIDQERIFSTISFGSDKNRSQVLPTGYELRVLDPVRELDSALLENQLLLERIQSNHHCLFTANVLDFKAVLKYIHNLNYANPRCLKIIEKVLFNIASEASYGVYILSGHKLIKNARNGPFWRGFENLKLAVKQCYQTGQF